MDAKELKILVDKVAQTQEEIDHIVMKSVINGVHSLSLTLSTSRGAFESPRLVKMCRKIMIENLQKTVDEAKKRMQLELEEQTEELRSVTLEFATGYKIKKQ